MEMGLADPESALEIGQLVNTNDCIFAATGITDNIFLQGVKTSPENFITHSFLIHGRDQHLRYIESQHMIYQAERMNNFDRKKLIYY